MDDGTKDKYNRKDGLSRNLRNNIQRRKSSSTASSYHNENVQSEHTNTQDANLVSDRNNAKAKVYHAKNKSFKKSYSIKDFIKMVLYKIKMLFYKITRNKKFTDKKFSTLHKGSTYYKNTSRRYYRRKGNQNSKSDTKDS